MCINTLSVESEDLQAWPRQSCILLQTQHAAPPPHTFPESDTLWAILRPTCHVDLAREFFPEGQVYQTILSLSVSLTPVTSL